MNKKISSTLVTMLVLGTVAQTSFATSTSFVDIGNSYAKDAILELQAKGIINGKDSDHFDPQGTLTRAEFATIVARSLGLTIDTTTSSFSDVSGWAVPYIEAAHKAGLIAGVGEGMFDPDSTVTREMAAVILVRALKTKVDVDMNATATFGDMDQVSDWAKSFVAVAQKYKLIKGDGVNFNPKGFATREAAASLGMNLLTTIEQESKPSVPPVVPPVTPPVPPPTGDGGSGIPTKVYVSSITVTGADNAVSIDTERGTLQMNAVVSPSNTTNKNITWTVSNGNATINSNGVLSAVANGEVTVKAIATDGSAKFGEVVIKLTHQAPVISKVSITSTPKIPDLEDDATKAIVGDTVILTFLTNEKVEHLSGFNINGSKPEVSTSIDNKNGTWTTVATHLLDWSEPEGVVKFQINIKNVDGIYSITTESTTDGSSVTVSKNVAQNPEQFVAPQDFDFAANSWGNGKEHGYNVGFKLDLDKLNSYDNIGQIKVSLMDATGAVLGTKTANINKLKESAADGEISALFVDTDKYGTLKDDWFTYAPYHMELPARAEIEVIAIDGTIYRVYNENFTSDLLTRAIDAVVIAESSKAAEDIKVAQSFVALLTGSDKETLQARINTVVESVPALYVVAQDFSKGEDGYNLGFKLNLTNLDYNEITSVTGMVYGTTGLVGRVDVNTSERIQKYADDDAKYGGLDGQLSFDFHTESYLKATAGYGGEDVSVHETSYMVYTLPLPESYNTTDTPTSATIVIRTKTGATITVNYTN